MSHRRICFACDLKPDENAIAAYRNFHEPGGVWPEVIQHIRDSGIAEMEIYQTGNRLFMIVSATEKYFKRNNLNPADAPIIVQEWEELMWKFQKALPSAPPGSKWVEMTKIFDLHSHL